MISETLLIGNGKERRIIIVQTILYVKTEDYISTFHLINKQKFVCSKPLYEIEEHLPDYFFQISRSCIVNLNRISSIKRSIKKIILSDTTELTVSARRLHDFHKAVENKNNTFTR